MAASPVRIWDDTRPLYLAGIDSHNGCLVGGFGQYGTAYQMRAVVSRTGLGFSPPGAPKPAVSQMTARVLRIALTIVR